MAKKAIIIILAISFFVILTAIPLFYFFFNFSPTGYTLRYSSPCKIGCENSFIVCNEKCTNDICRKNCKVQREKCLFYC